MFLRDLLGALEGSGVRYCVVDGVAVNLHGIPRATYDVDIVVAMDRDALRRCREALESLGLRCRLPLVLEDLADEPAEALAARNLIAVTFTDPSHPLHEVDVLVAPPVPVDGVLARATRIEAAEVAATVASLDDLIAMKRASGRPQDLADVAHLTRLAGRPV